MVTQLQHKAPAQTFAFLNKRSAGIFLLVEAGGARGFPLCPTKLIVCLVQRLTNLIQIFRWPDKGYSPLLPPLITTAINWPVWTRDLLHMKQASAALVTRRCLGNSRRASPRGLRGHISPPVSLLPLVSWRREGDRFTPPPLPYST